VLQVGLVIPAWDEAESIGAVLSEVPSETIASTWVVVRDARDPTADVARGHGANVLAQPRPGYGAACHAGAVAAIETGADVVAFVDGDYADPPSALPHLLEPILAGEADLALGCRELARAQHALPAHARLGNQLVLGLIQVLQDRPVPGDLPSYKAIRADALRHLDMHEMTYGWTVEMIVKALRANLRITEIRIPYRARLGGRSKVSGSLRGSIGAAWKLASCAVRYASWRPAEPRWSVVGGRP
jgi:glycosyltransferase involved in cell wall biosynthesis